MLNIHPVSPDVAQECIEVMYKLRKPLMMTGAPGIGKSSIVKQFCKKNNIHLIDMRLAQCEPGDFIVPFVNPDKEKLTFYLTNRIPLQEDGDVPPTIVFFDEITNCDPRVQTVTYEMILDHCLAGRPIHENTYFIAAGNGAEDGCNAIELSAALADRFCHLRVEPDLQQWMSNYAVKVGIAAEVMTFLKVKPEYFNSEGQTPDGIDSMIRPTPRSWEEVSDIFNGKSSRSNQSQEDAEDAEVERVHISESVQRILVGGRIGKAASAQFYAVLNELKDLPPMDALFAADTAKTKTMLQKVKSISGLYGLAYSATAYAKDLNQLMRALDIFDTFVKIKDDLPRAEVQSLAVEMLFKKILEFNEGLSVLRKSPSFENYRDKLKQIASLTMGL